MSSEALPLAETLRYWKTGKSDPSIWLEKATEMIKEAGGHVFEHGFLHQNGVEAFAIGFGLDAGSYRIVWPVCPSERGDDIAARRQAVTMLYHDVKARCIAAMVLGPRNAFLPFLVVDGARTLGSIATPELEKHIPRLLTDGGAR